MESDFPELVEDRGGGGLDEHARGDRHAITGRAGSSRGTIVGASGRSSVERGTRYTADTSLRSTGQEKASSTTPPQTTTGVMANPE
jgi:hypothetical protein